MLGALFVFLLPLWNEIRPEIHTCCEGSNAQCTTHIGVIVSNFSKAAISICSCAFLIVTHTRSPVRPRDEN